MQLFLTAGFGEGDSGNAPAGTDVQYAEIWTDEPESPAVRLVASRMGDVKIVDLQGTGSGVVVVVGDDFAELVPGKRTIKAKQEEVVCGPSTD